jgi:hypothetical protein
MRRSQNSHSGKRSRASTSRIAAATQYPSIAGRKVLTAHNADRALTSTSPDAATIARLIARVQPASTSGATAAHQKATGLRNPLFHKEIGVISALAESRPPPTRASRRTRGSRSRDTTGTSRPVTRRPSSPAMPRTGS